MLHKTRFKTHQRLHVRLGILTQKEEKRGSPSRLDTGEDFLQRTPVAQDITSTLTNEMAQSEKVSATHRKQWPESRHSPQDGRALS